jgi:hypothetical protein
MRSAALATVHEIRSDFRHLILSFCCRPNNPPSRTHPASVHDLQDALRGAFEGAHLEDIPERFR